MADSTAGAGGTAALSSARADTHGPGGKAYAEAAADDGDDSEDSEQGDDDTIALSNARTHKEVAPLSPSEQKSSSSSQHSDTDSNAASGDSDNEGAEDASDIWKITRKLSSHSHSDSDSGGPARCALICVNVAISCGACARPLVLIIATRCVIMNLMSADNARRGAAGLLHLSVREAAARPARRGQRAEREGVLREIQAACCGPQSHLAGNLLCTCPLSVCNCLAGRAFTYRANASEQ